MRGQIAVFQQVLAPFDFEFLTFGLNEIHRVQATEYALHRAGIPETVEGEGDF